MVAVADHLATLRRLIDQADAVSTHLQNLVERTSRSDAGSAKASVRLQERLRLGARMLKALQGQIDRVEAANEALEQQLSGLEGRLSQLIDGSCERLEAIAREAVRREIERQLNDSART
jgi:predicted transcriptional regulator